jgi:hypothetical protein
MFRSGNKPSLLDASTHPTLFWDGRRTSLESLIAEPLLGPR